MNKLFQHIFDTDTQKKAAYAGLALASIVAVERILNSREIKEILYAGSKQWVQTYLIALVVIFLYDTWKQCLPKNMPNWWKSLVMMFLLSTISWWLNYMVQYDSWWSVRESIWMFFIASGGILAHEHKLFDGNDGIDKKVYQTIIQLKRKILQLFS